MGWRLPCMIGHELPRSLLICIKDGSRLDTRSKRQSIQVNEASVAALVERYGTSPIETLNREHQTDAELAASYFALARPVFLRDGYHITLLFLFRDRKPVRAPIQIDVENVLQKYAMMRRLAVEVTKSGADTAIMVGEAWQARADELGRSKGREMLQIVPEVLFLQLVSKSGASFSCQAEIMRRGEEVSLGPTHVADKTLPFDFAPFFQAWGVPLQCRRRGVSSEYGMLGRRVQWPQEPSLNAAARSSEERYLMVVATLPPLRKLPSPSSSPGPRTGSSSTNPVHPSSAPPTPQLCAW